MICGVWRGRTAPVNADAYERIVRGQVIPGIEARHIPGFRSARYEVLDRRDQPR